ncbi:hypothetical protein Tco_0956509 [Tanacetum coccineum]
MEGTEITKQECESMLFNEFNKFTSEPRGSIHSYYLRYAKLINDMNMIPMSMTPMQIKTKFINHLQPEWSRFVTAAKQARDLQSVNFDQLQSQGYASSAGKNQATGARVVNIVGNAGRNQPRDKMLLAQAQEAGVVLNNEQQDFLADSLEETDDCDELQLQATTNFKADHVDAYDSDYSNILSLVPHYDTYHDFDVFNSNVQEMGYIENIVSNNKSYDELTSNSNVISYDDYMVTIGTDADNCIPPPVQNNDMILPVIDQMKSQVERCNTVNQETQSVNESLTNEHGQYKERVKTLENASKNSSSEKEALLDRELRTVICDRNRKVIDFENQIFSQQKHMENLNKHIAFLKNNFETLKKESFVEYEQNISEIVELEKDKKKLENIVYKVGQTAQTMHMLTKPQKIYDETYKTALGYKNPLYLRQAQRKQLALYNGKV